MRGELRMKWPTVTASQLHYGLATLATLKLITHFDVGFGAWCIAFWSTAIANDRLNTAKPT